MISQRFYCCGPKVVLNRLLCDLCGPRLQKRSSPPWVISSDCRILKVHRSLFIKAQSVTSVGVKRNLIPLCVFSLRFAAAADEMTQRGRYFRQRLVRGVYKRRKHQGRSSETLQLLSVLLLLCHIHDCICNIRVSGYLSLPCPWLKAIIIIIIIITNIYIYFFVYLIFPMVTCEAELCCFPLWRTPWPPCI